VAEDPPRVKEPLARADNSRVTASPSQFAVSPRGTLKRLLSASVVVAVTAGMLTTALLTPASASDPLTFMGTIGLPRLVSPEGVAADASGNVYVADRNAIGTTVNDRLVKYSADGVLLDVLAGPGVATGQVADPSAVAVAPSGAVYVLEKYSNSVNRVQEFDVLGNLITAWGDYGTGNGEFKHPQGIAVDSLGDVFVADTENDRIQEFTSSGGLITSWSASNPTGVAIDSSDVVYVSGSGTISRFDTAGNPLTSWAVVGAVGVAIDGSDNVWVTVGNAIKEYDNLGTTPLGTFGSGVIAGAESIAIGAGGKAYVAEVGNGSTIRGGIQRFSSGGATEIEWGQYPGAGVPDVPTGLAVDAFDNVYITKKATDQIQKFDADGNLLGEFGGSGNTNGKLDTPAALAIGPDGNLYVADTLNQRIQKLDTDGNYLAQWGSVGAGQDQVQDPAGIAVNPSSGNVYVADTGNDRIKEFSASGTFLREWGQTGSEDGNFASPKGIWIDGSNNVWVADSGNNRIQEFGSNGIFLAKWGAYGTGNGLLKGPSALAIDTLGTVWVVDKTNNRIQRFTTGGGYLSQLGSLGLETRQFNQPVAIAVDSTGRILVTDSNNHRVEVFEDKNGPDTTISGPAAVSPFTSATFTLTASKPNPTFHCALDGGPYAPCNSTKTYPSGLAEGPHTFYAYATDTLGFEGNPSQYPWTIDTTPPTASITGKPSSPTGSTTASFSFTSNEAGSTFLCARDSVTYAACPSPKVYSSLASGTHVFHVKAIDPAGNVSSATSYSWVIDTTPPTISITSGPSGYAQSTNATFGFSSGDSSATFQCKLDGGSYAGCTSPTAFSSLSAGQHTFYVFAVDNLGNQSSPAHRSWTVDTQTHRPDNQIATGTTYVGNDVYNGTGLNQTKTLKAVVGKTVTFKIRIENDGSGTDPLTVLGGGSAKGYSVTYFAGTTNITSKVVAGTYKISLAAAASTVLRMTVKVGSTASTSRSILVTTSADHEPTRLDAVKAVVKRA
jgi:DNA-binding beta-propeller fold protein YncE